uniref:Uncharacterized protein n=1 Tax=Arundo donax TaxID=35708 RepID=A0A0A8Y0S0_ARUDO
MKLKKLSSTQPLDGLRLLILAPSPPHLKTRTGISIRLIEQQSWPLRRLPSC